MNELECAKVSAIVASSYPGAAFSDENAAAYERQLADLEYPLVVAALDLLTKTSRFLPTVAEIRDAALDIAAGERRTGAEAWADVVKAIRHVGHYRNPRFADPIVADCVSSLGWRNLCLEGSNDSADRARFIELYDNLSRRERRARQAAPALAAPAARGHLPPARSARPELAEGAIGSVLGDLIKKVGVRA